MREVILFMHISLDSFSAGPNGELDWATMSAEMDNAKLILQFHLSDHLHDPQIAKSFSMHS